MDCRRKMGKLLFTFSLSVILISFIVRDCNAQPQNENSNSTDLSEREKKALSVFQIVKFPNTGCAGSSSMNGTCFTSSECTTKGGTAAGSCANGYGVCCVFSLGCGGTSSQNCTYFQSSTGISSGSCGITVCKCSTDICQLRVDFNTFVIAGPNTVTLTIGATVFGQPAPVSTGATSIQISQVTQCNTDTFTITGPAGSTPPVICGTNTGQHVYVDASDLCNKMTFALGSTPYGISAIPTRSWNLKITQISCNDIGSLAPSGCTQYFFGPTTGVISSFNWISGKASTNVQLANQNQRICFRREKNFCRICFTPTGATDFAVSGPTPMKGFTNTCCQYGTKGIGVGIATLTPNMAEGYDCVRIPGATSFTSKKQAPNAVCGGNLVSIDGTTFQITLCTMQTPFQFNFITDNYSYRSALAMGFSIFYQQTKC